MVSDEVVVFDNLRGRMYVIVHVDPTDGGTLALAEARIADLIRSLPRGAPREGCAAPRGVDEADFVSGFTEAGFKQAVERIKQYILDGDCMQVVLSQRLSIPFHARPLDLYRALRGLNPSPYMYFLDLGAFQIVGSSPEILTRLEDGVVTVRPIAGTRRRGQTDAEDEALEAELLADPKERAEHLMLVDLGRNDVGRVARDGSVEVRDLLVIERYSHVMHIVSGVHGEIREGLDQFDVLAACFPAGTVSGAPKIRAMEIIDELEPVRRGFYGGTVGYFGHGGDMDQAITIRTMVFHGDTYSFQAGAGIVADSVPVTEYREVLAKSAVLRNALELAREGL